MIMMQQVTFVPGDTVQVYQKIQEGEKTRLQLFEGVVLAIRGRGENKSFTAQVNVGNWPEKISLFPLPHVKRPCDRCQRQLSYLTSKNSMGSTYLLLK